ncbi:hypothetical protein PV10_08216 [Exophiala mesophila]|uniref:Histone chaperone RTT106/FACT complex subunit SPT16-like middle domain-containing protein n=1 Tax=Exophiala mesophila TaxID=212818 RepID=A0A0D1XK32_EXOME|nr:uncharacterized protein PV10_08216 [Exophiala mesophila]KIV88541.1 hypothetical protein PV10_08216 [Exophiala mesophila]
MAAPAVIQQAFGPDPALLKRVFDAINSTPQYTPLFQDIAQYHLSTKSLTSQDAEPATKKRKLNGISSSTTTDITREPILQAKDISFTLPQRKKFHLGISQHGSDFHSPTTTFSISATNPTTNELEFEIPFSDFAHALRLPVPEKATRQFNFCLLPKPTSSSADPLIWTVPDGPLKTLNISSGPLSEAATKRAQSDDILGAVIDLLMSRSSSEGDKGLTLPNADEFASATPESHRKSDTAYHVKAFRGSKDGFLWFLETGIFFGFKKPLALFALEDIESVSYTSVLQRTFNLNIAFRDPAKSADGGDPVIEEVELSMLDQGDFAGIDAYIKHHGLQDASLAESRRAKKLNINGTSRASGIKVEGAEDDEDAADDRTELEKAQQQLEDEEDEEEEDYDPGSDGESDGSGADSDDDSDNGGDYKREMAKSRSRDLVADELGSEAEDVSVTDEEEGQDNGEEEGEDAEMQDGYDEEDEEEVNDEHDTKITPAFPSTNGFATIAAPVPQGRWGHASNLPDPDDEDQL